MVSMWSFRLYNSICSDWTSHFYFSDWISFTYAQLHTQSIVFSLFMLNTFFFLLFYFITIYFCATHYGGADCVACPLFNVFCELVLYFDCVFGLLNMWIQPLDTQMDGIWRSRKPQKDIASWQRVEWTQNEPFCFFFLSLASWFSSYSSQQHCVYFMIFFLKK